MEAYMWEDWSLTVVQVRDGSTFESLLSHLLAYIFSHLLS